MAPSSKFKHQEAKFLTKGAKKIKSKVVKSKKKTSSKVVSAKKIMKTKSAAPKKMSENKSKAGPSKRPTVEPKAAPEDKFNIDVFITKKLGALNTKNENQIISGSSKSTLADLVKFNTNLAHSFYNITDMATLEVFLLALQPKGPSSGSILHPQLEHPSPGGPHDPLPPCLGASHPNSAGSHG